MSCTLKQHGPNIKHPFLDGNKWILILEDKEYLILDGCECIPIWVSRTLGKWERDRNGKWELDRNGKWEREQPMKMPDKGQHDANL